MDFLPLYYLIQYLFHQLNSAPLWLTFFLSNRNKYSMLHFHLSRLNEYPTMSEYEL